MLLRWTSTLFLVPACLGLWHSVYWTGIGCAILTLTSQGYYYYCSSTKYFGIKYLDPLYATAFTLASTAQGIRRAWPPGRGCPWHSAGVLCSAAAISVYLLKSKKFDSRGRDPWHALVHVLGAGGFTLMTVGNFGVAQSITPHHSEVI